MNNLFTLKNIFKMFGIIALVAVIGFGFAACNLSGETDTKIDLTVHISNVLDGAAITTATVGEKLYAVYSTGTVYWDWKKDGTSIGGNDYSYTPTEAGSYTVTVSAREAYKYNEATSAAVVVSATE